MRTAALIVLLTVPAWHLALAAPGNGFGLAGGPTAHSVRLTFLDGTSQRYTSAGLGVTGDAQFVVNERWSLDSFLSLTLERSHGDVTATLSNGMAGFQVRRWFGQFFMGAHLGEYTELLRDATHAQTVYGPGMGAAVGQERPDGLIWSAQLDLPRKLIAPGEVRVGLLLQVGWRWY